MNAYTNAMARAYDELQNTAGIIPVDVQKTMMDRALRAYEDGCSEDGIYHTAILAAGPWLQ